MTTGLYLLNVAHAPTAQLRPGKHRHLIPLTSLFSGKTLDATSLCGETGRWKAREYSAAAHTCMTCTICKNP